MQEIIRSAFTRTIQTVFETKPQVREFLLRHPALSKAIDEACSDVKKAELGLGPRMDSERVEKLAVARAKIFSMLALSQKEEELRTEAERALIKEKEARMRDAEAMLHEAGEKVTEL